jgi:hypothetical protein
MSTKPDARRIARGTLPPVVDVAGLTASESGSLIVVEEQIVDERPALRMTSHPPRFSTTTPGVMRRQPR